MFKSQYLNEEYNKIVQKYPQERQFHETVKEMLLSVDEIINDYPEYEKYNVIGRLLEPERTIIFKVAWMDQKGKVNVNTGYRIQYNSSLGIYKGGTRFDKSVDLSIMKFLAFEQTFKNALTALPMGGAKGGSDFDPNGRSEEDIMRFTQAYMSELYRHIGDEVDIPAGDLGAGKREVGYMYGYYKKLTNRFNAAFTGKDVSFGGVSGRIEATGNGLLYFTEEALRTIMKTSYDDKKVIVTGSGQVGSYAALKAQELGATVVAMSDISGFVYNPEGLDVKRIVELKLTERKNLKHYLEHDKNAVFDKNYKNIWKVKCDVALPCATQNELDEEAALKLIENGVILVGEGANTPTTEKAIKHFLDKKIIFAPSKAANSGGVYVSGLEIAQNHQFAVFTKEEIDLKLKSVMQKLFKDIYDIAEKYNRDSNLLFGANVLSFTKVADALIKQGVI